MNAMGSAAHFQNMTLQGRYSLQEVASEIQEIARVYEDIVKINSLMKSIATQSNLLSMKALEMIQGGEADRGSALAREACELAEFSSKLSKIIATMFEDVKESINKISYSTSKALGSSGGAGRAAGTEQAGKAAEAAAEFARIRDNISLLAQAVSRLNI